MSIINDRVGGGKLPLVTIAALGLCLAAAGCGNTLNGAKQDASTDAQKAQQTIDTAGSKTAAAVDAAGAKTAAAAHKAGEAIVSVPQNAGAVALVTPEVKTAILRDPVLNDPRNLINVSSHNHQTLLSGHVIEASMKQRAVEDAKAALAKHNHKYQVVDGLMVQPG